MDENKLAKSVQHVMVVFLFLFIALISYITYFQVFRGPKIAEDSGNIRILAKKNEVIRGTIYDRNGTALTETTKVNDLSQDRKYIYSNLLVHPLGYYDEIYGISGLELEYDDELSSSNLIGNSYRAFLSAIDFAGLVNDIKDDFINEKKLNISENFKTFIDKIKVKSEEENELKVGNSIVTTIDLELQQVASDALGDRKGSVVAINPKTGEILAMVSKPSFDPNDLEGALKAAYSGSDEETPLINRAIDGLYPPGSVFKTVTLSSALENIEGVENRTFNDQGKIIFDDGDTLNNYAYQAHGAIDLRYAYRVSSNVVFGTLAMELGNSTLKQTTENYGFNSVITGPGLSITASQFPTLESYAQGEIAQSGIGQGGVLSTPIQMALVAATVANDGVMMQPRLVNSILDSSGNTIKKMEDTKLKQVTSSDIASTIKNYMKYLVDNNIYRWPAFGGTNAGGKTGTADYKLADGTDAIPHAWFISAAPMDNPEIAVAVIVENGESGAGISAEIASLVVRKAVLGY
ncbi:MAG: penicillin-binding protein 2 [Clostridium sp.]|nr:penicillin-binding protein 2 [Clostridium sp.]